MISLVLLLWLAAQNLSSEALAHLQAGADADKRNQFATAITEFRQATQLAPELPNGFVGLGHAYMENHQYGEAVPPLKRALELQPDLTIAHQLLGYALLAQGYAAESIPHFERAQQPGALGIAQTESGQLAQAIPNLQAALAGRPNDPDLLYYLGRASGLLAKQTIDQLLAVHPDSARAHQAMAENYFVLRQMPQAEKDYLAALLRQPDLPGVRLELGLVYAASAEWPKAEQEFRQAASAQPGNAEAAYRLGSALLEQGKAGEALRELQRADRLQPEMPETLYALGKSASLDGNPALAEKSWTELLKIESDSSLAAETHFALSALYRRQGKAEEAAKEMREFERLKSPAASPANPSP
jgi:tetratricopeptide (TPR) repeat protein